MASYRAGIRGTACIIWSMYHDTSSVSRTTTLIALCAHGTSILPTDINQDEITVAAIHNLSNLCPKNNSIKINPDKM